MINVRYYGLWCIGITIMLSVFLGYNIKQNTIQLIQLREKEKLLQSDFKRLSKPSLLPNKTYHPIMLTPQKPNIILLKLIHTIEQQGFTVQTLQPLPMKNLEKIPLLPIKLAIHGQFNQWLALMTSLFNQDLQLGINDFTFQLHENGLVNLDMNLLLLCAEVSKHSLIDKKEDLPADTHFESIHTVPLEKIKMAGYAKSQQEFLALIQLPDGNTYPITVGDRIAKENARVIKISENATIVLIGQHQFIIK